MPVVENSNKTGKDCGLFVNDGSTDNFISGTVTQSYGNGVILGGTRNAFFGQSYNNGTNSSHGFDIKFTSTAVECVAYGYFAQSSQPENWGKRCVLNGHSVNNGDPNSTGDWNSHPQKAFSLGVTVWDKSTTPATPYKCGPGGKWVEM